MFSSRLWAKIEEYPYDKLRVRLEIQKVKERLSKEVKEEKPMKEVKKSSTELFNDTEWLKDKHISCGVCDTKGFVVKEGEEGEEYFQIVTIDGGTIYDNTYPLQEFKERYIGIGKDEDCWKILKNKTFQLVFARYIKKLGLYYALHTISHCFQTAQQIDERGSTYLREEWEVMQIQ
jgi:hypothetical protein